MKRKKLITVALVIFFTFGILFSIKQGKFVKEKASDNERKIDDIESQINY